MERGREVRASFPPHFSVNRRFWIKKHKINRKKEEIYIK
jgi:hypothetical protein